MTKHNSIQAGQGKPAPKSKPKKPSPDFPLYAHAVGQWAKKIRGQTFYFGPWADPDAALTKYLEQKDALQAGRDPDAGETLTIYHLCAAFLTAKRNRIKSGELSPRTFEEYAQTCRRLIKALGRARLVSTIGPPDFEKLRVRIAKKSGPYRLLNDITRIRTIFKYAYTDLGLDRPLKYGDAFKKPSKKTMRQHRARQGPKMFTAEEIKRMLEAANLQLKTMILLGINAGFGNSDCGTLPITALDLHAGWIHYARPKTGVDRRCKLWPETVAALREVLAARPQPKDPKDGNLVFITKYKTRWAKDYATSPISQETRKLLDQLEIKGRRNFYALRHTFETVAGASRDQVAVNSVMGHADDSMAAIYREHVQDDRLEAVAEYVRKWLWPQGSQEGTETQGVLPFRRPAGA